MFNEILTGKASLEQKPEDPYRQPQVPDVTIDCDQCRKKFTKKANSPATKCVDCHLSNAALENANNTYASPVHDDAGWRVMKVFIYIGVIVLLAIIKYNLRHPRY